MEGYPGANLTTVQILGALSQRVGEQLSIYSSNTDNRDFRSMVRNGKFLPCWIRH